MSGEREIPHPGWAVLLGALVATAIAAFVVAAGGTFGQRCGRIYEGAALERCMMRLAAGGALYEENIGYRP